MSANSQNFAAAVVPQLALAVTTGAATTNGTSIDLLAAPASEEVGFVGMYTTLGTSALFKIQDSADNSSFADISVSGVTATFAQSTTGADCQVLALNPKSVRRYIRYVGTVGTGPQVVGVSMIGVKKTV